MTDAPQHEDARYSEVLSFPSGRQLARRLPPLIVGLFLLGFGIAISLAWGSARS